ncbi:MAG TPA: response regulator [Myxococcales bacterium]|jgi:CheY-like chemotaxis protein
MTASSTPAGPVGPDALPRSAGEATPSGRLRALAEVVEALAAADGALPEALHRAVRALGPALGADRCSALAADGEGGALWVVATSDVSGYRQGVDLAKYPELVEAQRKRKPVLVRDALQDPLLAPVRQAISLAGVRTILALPLSPSGALLCHSRQRADAFDEEALVLAQAAGRVIGAAMESARLQAERERAAERGEARVRELEAALRRRQEACAFKDEAVKVFAHDVRSPLNILWGHSRLLAEAGLEKVEDGSVQAIVRQGKKILDLSEAMVARSLAEAAQPALVPAEIDLAETCRTLASESEILGAERGVSIGIGGPAKLGLLADLARVRELVQALLAFALGRAKQGGHVKVELETIAGADGELARVTVADDGPTPDPKEMLSLFERLRRGGPALSACRDLAELHGGEAWAEPATGGGLAVRFTLPGVGAKLPGGGLHPAHRPLVLVVEDEPAIAAIAAEMLETRYRVETAADGAEAIAKAHALHPDAVLMDVFLPRLDGLDATAAIKAAPDTRDTPVILVSAHQGVADKVRALHVGAADYLAKPFDAKTLLARVAAVLGPAAPESEGAARTVPGIDAATGLIDRAAFLRRVAQEASRARRYGRSLWLVAVGAPRSDVAARLGPAAAALGGRLREGDVLSHLGGGRFAVCLVGAGATRAEKVAGRLGEALKEVLGEEPAAGCADGLSGSPEESLAQALEAAGL